MAIGAHVTLESYKNGYTWSRFPERTHSGDRGTCHPGIIQEWLHMVSLPRADSQWRYGHMSPWNHTRMVTHGLASQSGLTVAIRAHVTLESYKNGYTWSRFPELTHSGDRGTCHPGIIQEWLHMVSLPERTHSGDRGTCHPGIIQEWLHMVSLPRADSQWR